MARLKRLNSSPPVPKPGPGLTAIWASSRNPINFAYQIAKGNMDGKTADLGENRIVAWRVPARAAA